MPLVSVEIVEAADGAPPAGLPQRLADAIGEILEVPAGQTWVRVRRLPAADYAESGSGPDATPVFVRLVRYALPDADELAAEARQLARAVATACGRTADQVHIVFEPDGRGRVAFGGELVT